MSTEAKPVDDRLSSQVKLYTVSEVAETMRLSRMSVYRLIHAGALPSLKVGSSFRVTAAALELFLTRADYTPTDAEAKTTPR
jgi:excisionase family DNA binding protein